MNDAVIKAMEENSRATKERYEGEAARNAAAIAESRRDAACRAVTAKQLSDWKAALRAVIRRTGVMDPDLIELGKWLASLG